MAISSPRPTNGTKRRTDRRRKSAFHVPRKARPGEAAGIGDRVLLHVEETEEDDGIRHRGRVIKIIDHPKHRVLGIFRNAPNGGGRLEPVDKKMLGKELTIPAGATAQRAKTAIWSRSRPAARRA